MRVVKCGEMTPDGTCIREPRHNGGCSVSILLYGDHDFGYQIHRWGENAFTADYQGWVGNWHQLGSYSTEETALEGLDRMRAAGIT